MIPFAWRGQYLATRAIVRDEQRVIPAGQHLEADELDADALERLIDAGLVAPLPPARLANGTLPRPAPLRRYRVTDAIMVGGNVLSCGATLDARDLAELDEGELDRLLAAGLLEERR